MTSVRRLLPVLALLVAAGTVPAAPAPLPKLDRRGPTVEQLVKELRDQGVEVRLVRLDSGRWLVTVQRPVPNRDGDYYGGAVLATVWRFTETATGSDPRPVLRKFLKPKEASSSSKP